MKVLKQTTRLIALSIIALTASCSDGVKETTYEVPTSYNFQNASYGGQIDRLNMLDELETYLKTANEGGVIDAATAKAMYANEDYTWVSEAFVLEQPTKDLKSKTFSDEQAVVELLIDELADLSVNGTLTTSADGEKTYLFNENGFEPIQLIAKGIMGSCFYYQGTSVYLSDAKMDVDALVNNEYTNMQHHFDESFGYLGAPVEFSIANTDGGVYWGKYAKKTINGGLETIDHLMYDGFILGRAAIDNEDYETRDEAIGTIRAEWEMIPVAAALHYLNGAIDDIADDALRNHALSEAIAFISALKYNAEASISATEVDAIIASLGTNLYEVTPEVINETRTSLAAAFGITNTADY
ncbi:MAG: DUF4856 domain-containing protein [Flavobacteriales bacterium]|nr:DUF4856 domain-containing protein [Flavobacteriales bacterium]